MSGCIEGKPHDREIPTITHFSSFDKGDMGVETQKESDSFRVDENDKNIPKTIRSILELYTKDVIVEAIITSMKIGESREYSFSMRGLFHCQCCLNSWRKGNKDAPSCCVEQATLAQDHLVHLGNQEARHIIKLLSDECFTDDSSVADVLNSINEHEEDGEFRILSSKALEPPANYFSPVLMTSQSGKTISGSFNFIPTTRERNSILFSPTFHGAYRGKRKSKNAQIIPIYEENTFSCSRHSKKKLFCLASGQPIDFTTIFSTGLLALCKNRQFFFSGRMRQDVFLPASCVTDTGIIYQWKKNHTGIENEKFENVGEIFVKTKKAFPEFVHTNTGQKCEWKFVLDRKLAELPAKFLQYEEIDESYRKPGILTVYIGGQIDEEGALQPKNKFRILLSKKGKLRIWPRSGGFHKIVYETFSDFETDSSIYSHEDSHVADTDDELNIEDLTLQPSGTPAPAVDPTGRSSRNINNESPSSNSLRNMESDRSFGRTPSVVSFREIDSVSERELFQKRSKNLLPRNQDVINYTVKNRTGKPTTKPGSLADSASAAKGQGETTQITPRPVTMSQRRESTVISNTKFQNYDSSSYSTGQPNKVTSSQTGVGNRTSARNFDPSKKRSTMLGEGSKATTPSTFARQREIQKKVRKEKDEVKAKYQDAAHHSIRSGTEPDNLTLGVTKTSAAALTAMEQAALEQQNTEAKIPVMKAHTGEIQVPKPRRKARKGAASKMKVDDLLTSTEDEIPQADTKEKIIDPLLEDIPSEFIDDFFLSDDEDYNFSDLSSLSDSEEEGGSKSKKNKSTFFPFLDGMTVLNFTESFSFSYFMMPGYVKEKNSKIKKGMLKLPVIEASKVRNDEKKSERRKSKTKTGLMKRIDKLNKFEGATDARMRQ
uniref:uncharacterized protein LOC120331697 n=1 Tax=Styela clava TaxID=7725 RepID=UPI00193A7059|nr:uncharacterized protein LOC120331697 [Styela clava]